MSQSILLKIAVEDAEEFRERFADLLCWHAGYAAARENMDSSENDPMGVGAVREMNIRLKRAIEETQKANPEETSR